MCHPEIPEGEVAPKVHTEEVNIPTDGDELPALLATAEGKGGPPILIVPDIFGRSPFYENLAARLATAGFTALLPELFFRQGPLVERTLEAAFARRAQLDENQTQRDFLAALNWLKARTNTEKIGTVGFCMGGTHVLDLTTHRDDLVTVCFYGFPARLPNATERTIPAPLEVVDRISGPILAFWGDQDQAAGMDNVNRLASALGARGVEFEHTVYPGLNHGFMADSGLDPEHPAYQAACDAWTRTLAFYRKQLVAWGTADDPGVGHCGHRPGGRHVDGGRDQRRPQQQDRRGGQPGSVPR